MPTPPNIYIFYGEDDFSLRQKVNLWKAEFAKKYTASSIINIDGTQLSEQDLSKKMEEILTPSLFSTKKLIIAQNCLPAKSSQEILIESLKKIISSLPSDYFLVFAQSSIDRRNGYIKDLLKQVNVVEFHLPHGHELDLWIKKQAVLLGIHMDDQAIERLAKLSGRDLFEEKKAGGRVIERKEFFDLWEIHTQLLKLASLNTQITIKEVSELVIPKISENVFALSDAVVAGDKKTALNVLEGLMNNDNMDDKALAIKLIGLLSEQVRSLLVVKILRQTMDQNEIAEFLGWSPGRVFITLKNSAAANLDKLKQLLHRLLLADAQVKSTDVNAKLLLDLLII